MNKHLHDPSRPTFPLEARFTSMAEELRAFSPCIVSIVGGGGKSSLMYGLGAALAQNGGSGQACRVLLTTTTRLLRPEPEQCENRLECEQADEIRLPEAPCTLVAARPAGPGQKSEYLRGFSGTDVDRLRRRGVADWIIVEADGSACRPLKAPVEKEPVIPETSGIVIAVAGLSAIGRRFSDSWVFRPEAFAAVTGLRPGAVLDPEAVASIFLHPQGLFKGSPGKAIRMAFLNQADAPGCLEAGIALARAVLRQDQGSLHGVYAGGARLPGAPCVALRSPKSKPA